MVARWAPRIPSSWVFTKGTFKNESTDYDRWLSRPATQEKVLQHDLEICGHHYYPKPRIIIHQPWRSPPLVGCWSGLNVELLPLYRLLHLPLGSQCANCWALQLIFVFTWSMIGDCFSTYTSRRYSALSWTAGLFPKKIFPQGGYSRFDSLVKRGALFRLRLMATSDKTVISSGLENCFISQQQQSFVNWSHDSSLFCVIGSTTYYK